jgi:hypothetical protein
MRVDERMFRLKLQILIDLMEQNECLANRDGSGGVMLSDETIET